MATRASRSRQRQDAAGTSGAEEENSQLTSQLGEVHIFDDEERSGDQGEPSKKEGYGDIHRLVLQGIMAAGYLDRDGVKKLFQESCKQLNREIPGKGDFYPFVQRIVKDINDRLKSYDMVIKSATCEISGDKFYVLLITIEKPIMKLQMSFRKVELQLFQKIIDIILRKNPTFSISLMDCMTMATELNVKGFTQQDAEDFVQRMITLQYFAKISVTFLTDEAANPVPGEKDEYEITLGFRTIREFEPVFREYYEDCFKNCAMCKMIVLNGLQCRKCPIVTHRACFKVYNKKSRKCPSKTCNVTWKSEKSLMVRRKLNRAEAASSSQNTSPTTRAASQDASQSQTASPTKRRTFTGEEIDMPILEPMVFPGSSSSSQVKRKKKRDADSSSREASPKKKTVRPGPASSKLAQTRSRKNQQLSDSESD